MLGMCNACGFLCDCYCMNVFPFFFFFNHSFVPKPNTNQLVYLLLCCQCFDISNRFHFHLLLFLGVVSIWRFTFNCIVEIIWYRHMTETFLFFDIFIHKCCGCSAYIQTDVQFNAIDLAIGLWYEENIKTFA